MHRSTKPIPKSMEEGCPVRFWQGLHEVITCIRGFVMIRKEPAQFVDHNDFQANLARTAIGENETIELLDRKFKHLKMHPERNDTKEFDLKGWKYGELVTFEVKEDFRCHGVFEYITGDSATGNIPVEEESRGKSSGIRTSEADYWIFRVNFDRYRVNHYMITLRNLICLVDEEEMYSFVIERQKHTDSHNKTFMFKFNTLKDYCVCIDDIKDYK